jgi:hypothetical protein
MTSRGDGGIPRLEPERNAQKQSFAQVIRSNFREAMKRLVNRAPAPQPQARRRGSGERVGTFRAAARSILRPVLSLPCVSHTIGCLQDILTWLHICDPFDEPAAYDDTNPAADNHLSPRL